MVPNALSMIVLESADRLMIGKILGQYELGIYNAAYTYAALLMALVVILRNTFAPSLLRSYIHQGAENLRKVVLISYLNLALALGFGGALALASPLWFDYILGEQYQSALVYAPWLIGGLMFMLMEHLFASGLNARKDTRVIGMIGLFAALLNVGLNFALLPVFGLNGAVVATFLSYALKTLAYFLYVQRHYQLPWLSVRLSWAEVREHLRW